MASFLNGQVQIGTYVPSNNTSQTTSSNSSSDFNIFPVGTSIDATNFVYDNQTIVMVNSSTNSNINTIKAQYFDPLMTNNWNFDMTSQNFLNGVFSSSELLSDATSSYLNLQPLSPTTTGKYTIDILNGSSDGSSKSTEFFSLTSQPYACVAGLYTQGTGIPTYNNVNPSYSTSGTDSFLMTSNYYVQQKNEILIIQLIFTITNTSSLNTESTSLTLPLINVQVINKVITKDAQASLASGYDQSKTKVYNSSSYPLNFMQNGQTFNPTLSYNNISNTLPIVFAPGFVKLSATLPVIYVPPVSVNGTYLGQYLNGGNVSNAGYTIDSGVPTFNSVNGFTQVASSKPVQYGHFVIGVAYNSDGYNNSYTPSATIYAEYMIKNIWRSPISIFNSYDGVSINDLANKKVILLFGTNSTGGIYLVINTGTPINVISAFGVTTLSNFMMIMRALRNNYNGDTSYMSYITDQNVINQINSTGNYNITPVQLNRMTDGTIMNPPTVKNCPGMSYMLLNTKNSANMSIDITQQNVFNGTLGISYMNMSNIGLCSVGLNKYYNSILKIFSAYNGELIGNSYYIGQMTGTNSLTYYVLIILPETTFNPNPVSTSNNVMSIFSNVNSPFYITVPNSTNGQIQFSPNSNTNINKLTMSVSNSSVVLNSTTLK
jgi:hypothetical protein